MVLSTVRLPERRSAAARWSRRLAVFAIPLILLTILLHRFGGLDTTATLILVGLSLAFAAAALVTGIAALVDIWRRGGRGTRHALLGIVIAAAILAWPTWRISALATLPPINDVTTDWRNPPALEIAAQERPAGANEVSHPGISFVEQQAAAYPEIAPVFLPYPAEAVFEAARQLVADRGWRELASSPPEGRQPGRIEAVAHTLILGFQDDVAIRVSPRGPQETRVDMRSASRIGRHDLGENAERIYGFLTDLRTLLETPPETEIPGQEADG